MIGRSFQFGWDYHLLADPQIYFAAGVVAYLCREAGWRLSLPIAAALLGFAYAHYYDLVWYPSICAGVFFAFGCAALIVALIDLERFIPVPRAAVAVGDASYSLYLWHWLVIPVCALYFEGSGGSPEAWRWMLVAASVCVSLISYRLIEAPIITLSHWTLKKPAAA